MTEEQVFLGLGANLGDPVSMLSRALEALDALDGVAVTAASSFYRTSPIGVTDQPDFINLAAEGQTHLAPDEFMSAILKVERKLGRIRTERWGPRTIDIDLLLYGAREIDSPILRIPHPRMLQRRFVLVPLLEIAPELRMPGTLIPLRDHLSQSENQGNIQRLHEVNRFNRNCG